MPNEEVSIRIGGAAGDGVASTGENFARTASRSGLHVYAYNSYQSVIRGGHVWYQIRASREKVLTVGQHVDLLIALNQQTADQHVSFLRSGGGLIRDPKKVKVDTGSTNLAPGVRDFPIPLGEIAKKYSTNPILQNTVAIGAAMQFIGAPFDAFVEVVKDTFGHKSEKIIDANVQAAREGWSFAETNWGRLDFDLHFGNVRRPMMTGNQAIGLGALVGGCRFYSFYPMTPASSIGHYLAEQGPSVGMVVKQAEDEIAVINMAIGAAYGGARSMVGTSGGGFSLMVEALGMAGMTETPVVAVLSQRGGPSTGLPTKTEQGDLNLALGAGQGDYPRIILAPRNVTEAYEFAARAHNLAERWQLPVLLLSDLLLSEHMETVEQADLHDLDFPIDRGALWNGSTAAAGPDGNGSDAPFLRYQVTPSGVSPRSFPGQANGLYTAGSDEHDEDSTLVSDVRAGLRDAVEVRIHQMEKRMRKLHSAFADLRGPEVVGPPDAPITLTYWGSTQGAAREAMKRLAKENIAVNAVEFFDIFPLEPAKALAPLARAKHVIFIEGNYTGQFSRLLRAETGFATPSHLRKFDGEPFWPEEIVAKVKSTLRGTKEVSVPPASQVPVTSPDWALRPLGEVK
ncbi:MAG: 2-oxoacid:acceptor oxidoreductase subunit alpha [Thermoplasmatota archaeon]